MAEAAPSSLPWLALALGGFGGAGGASSLSWLRAWALPGLAAAFACGKGVFVGIISRAAVFGAGFGRGWASSSLRALRRFWRWFWQPGLCCPVWLVLVSSSSSSYAARASLMRCCWARRLASFCGRCSADLAGAQLACACVVPLRHGGGRQAIACSQSGQGVAFARRHGGAAQHHFRRWCQTLRQQPHWQRGWEFRRLARRDAAHKRRGSRP